MNEWKKITEKYHNSVIQLKCIYNIYNPYRPQLLPIDKNDSGTGFIVNIQEGLILTNAHVVSDTISIIGRINYLGQYDLSIKLISICREKDTALCQLSVKDRNLIIEGNKPEEINMKFGDNLLLSHTSPVLAIGYPLGQKNIKYTTGIVSGFFANKEIYYKEDDENSDKNNNIKLTEEEGPSYIQITAPINPGNSGGPLLNLNGEVIGMNSAGYNSIANIAFAIGSRTIMSIYENLKMPLKNNNIQIPYQLITPKYSFEYCKTTTDLLELYQTGDAEGVYIKKIYPNSCFFNNLQIGDIVTSIYFNDSRFPITKFGDIIFNSHTFSIKELFDIIPMNTQITLEIFRQEGDGYQKLFLLNDFIPVDSSIKYPIYPSINNFKYVVIGGLSISELSMNHIQLDDNLIEYSKGDKRFTHHLIINQIFPNTDVFHSKIFKEGLLISEINNTSVSFLNDLLLISFNNYISIKTTTGDYYIVNKATAYNDDYLLSQSNNIPQNCYILL